MSSPELASDDIDLRGATRWLIASAVVVFACGILAIGLPITFSVAIARLLGSLLVAAAIAHVIFGIYFGAVHWGWHAAIAGFYFITGTYLLVNPLLGVVLLALIVGVVLIAEGIIEIFLFFMLRQYRHAMWIVIDGIVTLGLGFMLCARWPPDTPDIIQYLVGLGFLSSGISRLVLVFAIRVVEPTATRLR